VIFNFVALRAYKKKTESGWLVGGGGGKGVLENTTNTNTPTEKKKKNPKQPNEHNRNNQKSDATKTVKAAKHYRLEQRRTPKENLQSQEGANLSYGGTNEIKTGLEGGGDVQTKGEKKKAANESICKHHKDPHTNGPNRIPV